MKLLYIFLSLFLIIGCRTSKSVVEKHKESFSKEEFQLNKFDSVSKIIKDNFSLKVDSSNWKEVSNQFDFTFKGESNEDEFEFIKTDNGFKFKGKGTATYKGSSNYGDSTTIKNKTEQINENSDIKKNEVNQSKVDESKSKVDKNKENKSTGFNWNFTILLIVIGSVVLILLWKFGLPKLKNK